MTGAGMWPISLTFQLKHKQDSDSILFWYETKCMLSSCIETFTFYTFELINLLSRIFFLHCLNYLKWLIQMITKWLRLKSNFLIKFDISNRRYSSFFKMCYNYILKIFLQEAIVPFLIVYINLSIYEPRNIFSRQHLFQTKQIKI